MAAISGIEPVGAPQTPQREQRENRAPVEYGAAVTHRDMVKEKLRVDPAALAEKKRQARPSRSDDKAPDHRGRHVDIRV